MRNGMRRVAWLLPALWLAGCVPAPERQPEAPPKGAPVEAPAAGSTGVEKTGPIKTDPAISSALVDLLQNKDKAGVDLSNAQGTPLGDLLTIGSPVGYQLRNRYLNIGVPLAEGLSRDNSDPDLRSKLVELARWDRNAEVRSAGLLALAKTQDVRDLDVFREALVNVDPAVRFGAIEALAEWGHNDLSLPLLFAASERDYEPILRVYAASRIAKVGDPQGLYKLRAYLDDPSWLIRAIAARYLGKYGTAEDYDLLVSRIGREQSNDFTVAEFCIAALKLFPKKSA